MRKLSRRFEDGSPAVLITEGAPTQLELIKLDLRAKRNYRLKLCDWTVGVGSPLSDSKKAEWETYRQTLRDFPATITTLDKSQTIIWPDEPEDFNNLHNGDYPKPSE